MNSVRGWYKQKRPSAPPGKFERMEPELVLRGYPIAGEPRQPERVEQNEYGFPLRGGEPEMIGREPVLVDAVEWSGAGMVDNRTFKDRVYNDIKGGKSQPNN